MIPVAQVGDYEQWAKGASRGRTGHLGTAAFTTAPAGAAPRAEAAQAQQLSGAQVDDERYHTYYYRPRCDPVNTSYFNPWPRNPVQYSGQYSGQYYYPTSFNNPYSYHHNWYGRTASEVHRDNLAFAENRHGKPFRRTEQEMIPRDPGDDQLFWVKELDGNWTLRSYNTIENDLRPGHWDQYHGRVHFIRTRN